jgi:hypothetical protein
MLPGCTAGLLSIHALGLDGFKHVLAVAVLISVRLQAAAELPRPRVAPRQALRLRAPRCRLAHDTPVDNCYPSRMP